MQFLSHLIANSNSVCKPAAILVRFLTTIGFQLTKSSNFEQQFHNKAGAHTHTLWLQNGIVISLFSLIFYSFCFCELLSNGFRENLAADCLEVHYQCCCQYSVAIDQIKSLQTALLWISFITAACLLLLLYHLCWYGTRKGI